MKPDLYQRVVLTRDIPEENLKEGDLAWLIDYVAHPGGGEEGAVLEVFNILGGVYRRGDRPGLSGYRNRLVESFFFLLFHVTIRSCDFLIFLHSDVR